MCRASRHSPVEGLSWLLNRNRPYLVLSIRPFQVSNGLQPASRTAASMEMFTAQHMQTRKWNLHEVAHSSHNLSASPSQGKLDCASFHWPIKILCNQMWEACKEYNILLSNALVILAWASGCAVPAQLCSCAVATLGNAQDSTIQSESAQLISLQLASPTVWQVDELFDLFDVFILFFQSDLGYKLNQPWQSTVAEEPTQEPKI